MRYSANTLATNGLRINLNQVYPFHFPPKRVEDVHAGFFTIFPRRSFSKRKNFNRVEEESFFRINYSKA
jgi:hypothetical protein